MDANDDEETYLFQEEIVKLISLILKSFNSNKEIFLRELVFNASNALSKIQCLPFDDPSKVNDRHLYIKIIPNAREKTLTIIDNGIGMTKYDLINNFGSIAKFNNATNMDFTRTRYSDLPMIGHFGVGFYSVYLVANKVTVISKHERDKQQHWESDGVDSFSIRSDNGEPLERGTKIILHIKEDQTEFLQHEKITAIINKYTQFIDHPIKLIAGNIHIKEVSDDETDDDDKTNENKYMKYEDKIEKKMKIIQEKCLVEHIFNDTEPIWTRNPNDISQDEYGKFYKSLTSGWETYLAMKHFFFKEDEGCLDLKALLFIPKPKPLDQYDMRKKNKIIKLYVRSVFVMDYCKELLPDYLSFIKCVVDTTDFPLDISSDKLQDNDFVKCIRETLVKESLALLEELAENKGEYKKFYRGFNSYLKIGIHADNPNKTKLSNLLRFYTSASGDEACSLKDYVSRMKPNQTEIYYIIGENRLELVHSVFIERITSCGYEVIYMTDPMDEYVVDMMSKYDGKNFISVAKEGLDIPETVEDNEKREQDKSRFGSLCKVIKDILGKKVEKVSISNRLVQSPCCIVTPQNGWSVNMGRLIKTQLVNHSFSMDQIPSTKFMEINPDNRIINALRQKAEDNPNDKAVRDLVVLLFETSMLSSGFTLECPKFHANRIHRMIELGLGIDEESPADENQIANFESNPLFEANFEKSLNMEEVD